MLVTYVDQGIECDANNHHDTLDPNDTNTILDIMHPSVETIRYWPNQQSKAVPQLGFATHKRMKMIAKTTMQTREKERESAIILPAGHGGQTRVARLTSNANGMYQEQF